MEIINSHDDTFNQVSLTKSTSSIFWTNGSCNIPENKSAHEYVLWRFSKKQKKFVICELKIIKNYLLYTNVSFIYILHLIKLI